MTLAMSNDTEYSQGLYDDGAAILREGVMMTVDEIVAKLNELGGDAARYRKLRVRDWTQRSITVVANSASIKLGHECLSHEELDKALDDLESK